MLKKFIERPVLSTVVSIILVILGILSLVNLPVSQYPDIAPTTVSVSTTYPGADAATVLKSVIIPIEEQINGVEGMTYLTSTATNSGRAEITVYFKQSYDPDIAAVNVQNRVALASPLLPAEVKQIGVTTKKKQSSALMYLEFYSTNPEYGSKFIANYLNINVTPIIKRVDGVGDVSVYSSRTYAMRVWLQPDKLAAYGLEPSDITAAINAQSQEAAAGTLGENTGQTFSYTIRYSGRLDEVKQYENIVIKALGNGKFLRLKDVANIELGVQNYGVTSKTLGHPSIAMSINQTKGSNAHEIIDNIKEHLAQIKKNLPRGIKIFIPYDTNQFLNASIHKVVETLLEAFILVFLVIFIFLQDFRSTLIPAIAVPVSIIGTFFFLNLFGYSVNLLTLFALVLAIGLVVDDAIVVVEAVHAKLDEGATDVKKATITAMDEITGAIVSITLVMASVFLPVTFIQGTIGIFFKQFGVTLMTAIVISAVNALTLSPALCAVFLKPKSEEVKKKNVLQRFYMGFNVGFNATLNKYTKALSFLYRHKWVTPAIIILAGLGIWWASSTVPTGFIPKEDRGIVFMDIQLPIGSSLDATVNINNKVTKLVKQIPGVEGVSLVGGYSLLAGQGSNHGLGFIKLDDFKKRKGKDDESVDAITAKLFQVASNVNGAKILFFAPPSVPGFSASGGFEVNLLDKSGGSFKSLDKENQQFLQMLNKRPEIQYAQSSFSTDYPQYELNINVPLATQSGVDINSIFRTLQGYIGGIYTADFSKYGKQYRVYVQAPPTDRVKASDLNSMFVRTKSGEMTPITQFVSLKRVYGPQSVTRFNLYNSTKITGAAASGYTSGDALKAIQEVAKKLPANFGLAFSGLSREQVISSGQISIIFLLVVIFAFFVLAAQYESYVLPFSILLSVPLGIFGAYLGTMVMGLENNIYFQIAMIMLIGLLAKNAILIVEFAIQRRRQGETLLQSALDGAKVRLRPILMTSFAFIFGLLPLALATGIGAQGDRSIGTSAVSGMLIGTITGVFVIPTLYIFFQWIQEKITGVPEAAKKLDNG
ncbi:MAG TPA: efflux RND transporter permease subunit [Chitinophagaceae bacterium]|nr:efflux RND transporter permease subunit [Chitinophagaceae bacterium]